MERGGDGGREPSGIFNEAAARSSKVAVPFLGIMGLHRGGLRVQLVSPDDSREVHSHLQNNCSSKTTPAQSRGRGAEGNQVSNALAACHKGTIHCRQEGFSPLFILAPNFY